MSQLTLEHVQEVKRRHENDLLRKPNVVGVGIGYHQHAGQPTDEICIIVSVKAKVTASPLKREDQIPTSIENVPVDVVATGEFRAL